jgi:hypothetical protein
MNLSISSFRNELKVFIVVLSVLGALDLSRRYDFAHRQRESEAKLLNNFPAMADKLASQSGTRMILLGNSLAQNGYDMPLLKSTLNANGHGDLRVEKFAQAGSSPIEWYHNFANIFVARGKTPDVVVINMSPNGMADQLPAGYRVGWLANETNWHDVPEVLFKDLKSVEVGGQYLQARVSMLYADRWDIRIGILYPLIPHLWEGMTWVNTAQLAAKPAAGKIPPPPTYSLFNRLLDLAQASHTKAILVAMPSRDGYSIDPEVIRILNRHRAKFLDCRNVPGLTTEDFEDGWHLNPKGAKIFSVYMAAEFRVAVIDTHQYYEVIFSRFFVEFTAANWGCGASTTCGLKLRILPASICCCANISRLTELIARSSAR